MLPLTLTVDTGPEFKLETFTFPRPTSIIGTGAPRSAVVVEEKENMFGHPGISALEFAGANRDNDKLKTTTLALRGKFVPGPSPTQENFGAIKAKSMPHLDPPHPIMHELGNQQGRRGLFLNHTPRDWETKNNGHGHKGSYASSDASKTTSWTQHWRKTPPRDWSAEDVIAVVANGPGPAEIDEKEEEEEEEEDVGRDARMLQRNSATTQGTYSRPQTATQSFIASSMAAKIATPPALNRSSARSSMDTGSLRTSSGKYPQNTGKRRRRQTPFKLSGLGGKHSPLEPWVAYHRREASITSTIVPATPQSFASSIIPETPQQVGVATVVDIIHRREGSDGTSSTVVPESSPPKVESQDIGDTSTYRAIQEYFDSQTPSPPLLSRSPEPEESDHISSPAPQNIALPISPTQNRNPRGLGIDHEPSPTLPVEVDIGVPSAPEVPCRSPKRPSYAPTDLLLRTTSSASDCPPLDNDADFASATQGQYSPYSASKSRLPLLNSTPSLTGTVIKRRVPHRYYTNTVPSTTHVTSREAILASSSPAPAGSSKLGRMAPPILGHEALTATADLNDLSFYLKNTGPSPDPSLRSKTRRPNKIRKGAVGSLRIFKARNSRDKRKSGGKLAARVGSVESPPRNIAREYRERVKFTPACAREMMTSGGARYRGIVIPSDENESPTVGVQDSTVTVTVCSSTPSLKEKEREKRRFVLGESIAWTEEMLNPLASPALEQVIGEYDGTSEEKERKASSSPKRSPPISAARELVDDHPLLTREDKIRARKLRDLRNSRRQSSLPANYLDTMAGAQDGPRINRSSSLAPIPVSTLSPSPPPCDPEPTEDPEKARLRKSGAPPPQTPPSQMLLSHDHQTQTPASTSSSGSNVSLLKKRVVSLQRQNTELMEALAKIVGFEAEGGGVDTAAVLSAYKQIKAGSSTVGNGVGAGTSGKGGRVFTT